MIEGIAAGGINHHGLAGAAMRQRLGEHGRRRGDRKRDAQNPREGGKLFDSTGALAIRGDNQRRRTAQHHARGELGGRERFSCAGRAGQQQGAVPAQGQRGEG